MTIVIIYIVSAFLVYMLAYKLIRHIDKSERQKLNKWEYTTLKEVKEILSKIYSELPENITLGEIVEFIENEQKAIEPEE